MKEMKTSLIDLFKPEIKVHDSLLSHISRILRIKFGEIIRDVRSANYRVKRGLIDGLGSIFKCLTGNLDSND